MEKNFRTNFLRRAVLKLVKAHKRKGDVGVDISVPGGLLVLAGPRVRIVLYLEALEAHRVHVGHLFGILVLQGPWAYAVCAVCAVLERVLARPTRRGV